METIEGKSDRGAAADIGFCRLSLLATESHRIHRPYIQYIATMGAWVGLPTDAPRRVSASGFGPVLYGFSPFGGDKGHVYMGSKRASETIEEIRNRLSMNVAVNPDLEGTDLRVFLYLSAQLDEEGFARVPQLEMAMSIGKRKEHISRAIRRLTEAGVIMAGPKGNRASEWKLNPDYGR